jgi:hypothetical protein
MSTQKSKLASNEQHDWDPQSGPRPALRKRFRPSAETTDVAASGFSGICENASLADWLQLVQIGRRDAVMGVRTPDGGKGLLWCREGEIIDAWCDGLNGEEAVYRVLSWERGRISVAFATFEHARRIEIGTTALLLRAAFRKDSGLRPSRAPIASVEVREPREATDAPTPAPAGGDVNAVPPVDLPARELEPKPKTLLLAVLALVLLAVLGRAVALNHPSGEPPQRSAPSDGSE